MASDPPASAPQVPRHGVARVVSKMGLASRSLASRWVSEGRVRVNGLVVRDPDHPVRQGLDQIDIDGQPSALAERLVVMVNSRAVWSRP